MYREELCDGDYENDEGFEHVGYISEGEEYSISEYYSTFGYQEAEGLYSVDEE
jgi:hypothetical protein